MGKSKIKNPCKLCNHSVNAKTGIQCKGACKKWAHFTCLKYSDCKIHDIKAGIIKISCPCPDCNNSNKEVSADTPDDYSEKHLQNTCPNNESPKISIDGTYEPAQTNLCGDCSINPQEYEDILVKKIDNSVVVTQTETTGSQIVCAHGYATSPPPCPPECPFNNQQPHIIPIQTEETETCCPHGFIAFICPPECQGSTKTDHEMTTQSNTGTSTNRQELCTCTKQLVTPSFIMKPLPPLLPIQKHLKATQPYFLSPRMLCPAANIKAHLHRLNPSSECPIHKGDRIEKVEDLKSLHSQLNTPQTFIKSELAPKQEQNLLFTHSKRQPTTEKDNLVKISLQNSSLPSQSESNRRVCLDSTKSLNRSSVKSSTTDSYSSTTVTNSMVSSETMSEKSSKNTNNKVLFSVVKQMCSIVGNLSSQINDLLHQMRNILEKHSD